MLGVHLCEYKGQPPPLLTDRTNLTPEFVKTIVRNGLFGMPRTRKTEINDAELDDVAAYLTRKKLGGSGDGSIYQIDLSLFDK